MRNIPLLALATLALAALMVVINVTRPPLPVDETRYLTVAWEYYTRGQWILPTLNFEPYHHKPPMLFWLINGLWQFFGETSIWAARLVTLIGTVGTLFLTYAITRRLWPDDKAKAEVAVLMLAAAPFFLLYGSLIMFDTLLTLAVLIGVYALIRFYTGGSRWNFMLLALAFGLGALIKGPVILLHLVPLILLFPLIRRDFQVSRSIWLQGFLFALIIGATIGLAWAIPAAKIGGPEYEQMIFWGQSTGRMVQSFDHARPFWFYLVTLPLLTLPWMMIPGLFRRGEKPAMTRTWQTRFLLAWIIPPFLAFMMISGKQVHYLIPLLPGLFILAAHYLTTRGILSRIRGFVLYAWATAPTLLVLIGAMGIELYAHVFNADLTSNLMIQLQDTHEHFIILAVIGVIALGRYIYVRGFTAQNAMRAVLLGNVIALAGLHFSLAPMLAKYYDLTPVADIVRPYAAAKKPIAVARAWHGEIGYLAGLTSGVEAITIDRIPVWLARNPRGIVILRHRNGEIPKGFKVIHTQPYRSPDKSISILGR